MTNGAEAVFVQIALYYYSKLTHSTEGFIIFDKNLIIMTLAITLAFIVRSSSLLAWIPLAIATIFSSN